MASWCLFDFANSPFTTVVITVVYAVYFSEVVAAPHGAALWGLTGWIANTLIIVSAPVIGAIADRRRTKKRFLFASWTLCIGATLLLFLPTEGDVLPAMLLVIIANVAFATGENLVAAFLPELVRPDEVPRVSARGWAIGYVGGLLALMICLPLAQMDRASDWPVRACMPVVAGFFLLGGLPMFLFVSERHAGVPRGPIERPFRAAFAEVRRTWSRRAETPDLFRFFASYLCFNVGIYGVIGFAAIYGGKLFGLAQETIIVVFIAIQLVSAGAALAAGRVAAALGTKSVLAGSLVVWTLAGAIALVTSSEAAYWVVAALAGAAMGASLPTARAMVALLAPEDREAEIFGFWGLFARMAACIANAANFLVLAIATGLLGLGENAGLRGGIALFVASFALGLALLSRVRVPR